MGWDFSLSPSKIGVMNNCLRCFYDANILKIPQPRGIFPGLPGGVDRVMKGCFDANRSSWPVRLQAQMEGRTLWGSVAQIDKLRNWRSGLKATLTIKKKTVSLIGALDDLVVEADGTYSPYDTKTKGDVPKDSGKQYYQHQLDLYALLLRENGMTPSGKGYLNYWYPVVFADDTMRFENALYTLDISAAGGELWLTKAVDVLTGKRPALNHECEYCMFADTHYRQRRAEEDVAEAMAEARAQQTISEVLKEDAHYGK